MKTLKIIFTVLLIALAVISYVHHEMGVMIPLVISLVCLEIGNLWNLLFFLVIGMCVLWLLLLFSLFVNLWSLSVIIVIAVAMLIAVFLIIDHKFSIIKK